MKNRLIYFILLLGISSALYAAPSDLPTRAFLARRGRGVASLTLQVATLAVDGDGPLTVASVTQGSAGTVTIVNHSLAVKYVASSAFSGEDTFTYTLINQKNETSTATVTVEEFARFKGTYALDVFKLFVDDQNPPSPVVTGHGRLTISATGVYTIALPTLKIVTRGQVRSSGAIVADLKPIKPEQGIYEFAVLSLQLRRENSLPFASGERISGAKFIVFRTPISGGLIVRGR